MPSGRTIEQCRNGRGEGRESKADQQVEHTRVCASQLHPRVCALQLNPRMCRFRQCIHGCTLCLCIHGRTLRICIHRCVRSVRICIICTTGDPGHWREKKMLGGSDDTGGVTTRDKKGSRSSKEGHKNQICGGWSHRSRESPARRMRRRTSRRGEGVPDLQTEKGGGKETQEISQSLVVTRKSDSITLLGCIRHVGGSGADIRQRDCDKEDLISFIQKTSDTYINAGRKKNRKRGEEKTELNEINSFIFE